ncbi:hypothetical protein [Methanosarcina siciliae]|nr:hypothetical protein [Methanosarcina siciliae]
MELKFSLNQYENKNEISRKVSVEKIVEAKYITYKNIFRLKV